MGALKRRFSRQQSPSQNGARDWYNDKSIEPPHLWAYEGASWYHHTLFQLSCVAAAFGT
ncbi:hypothetical protein [Bartonella queenslandensis]|uniref:hypothetical protein n=1 Tax=Bartonella queenslandensis TaxID=481138 RepID=UPI001BAC7DEB|nr:hypothetical protein [Bartonella queenslandensis]